jgi:acylpyruvate hydrolase
MRFFTYLPDPRDGAPGPALGAWQQGRALGLPPQHRAAVAGGLLQLLQAGGDAMAQAERLFARHGVPLDADTLRWLPPVPVPPKILCVGLNYRDHTKESGFEQPAHPTVFGRFASSLAAHGQPIVRPDCSPQLDFEGELVLFIGKGGRGIAAQRALEHVAGYAIGNESSVRDYQFKSSQWTLGKNFDGTAAVGPLFVSAGELPPAARGLKLQTRLNGQAVQSAWTDQMVFEIPEIIACLSEAMTLEPGTVIFTGTPAGVGLGRQPPLWMKPGDVVEVEIEGLGRLVNPIVAAQDVVDDVARAQAQEVA